MLTHSTDEFPRECLDKLIENWSTGLFRDVATAAESLECIFTLAAYAIGFLLRIKNPVIGEASTPSLSNDDLHKCEKFCKLAGNDEPVPMEGAVSSFLMRRLLDVLISQLLRAIQDPETFKEAIEKLVELIRQRTALE